MAIARISGTMLQANLERQGTNLSIDAAATFDVVNYRLGVNNNTPQYTLDVNGSANISGNAIINSTIISIGTVPVTAAVTIVDSWNTGVYRSAKYTISSNNAWDSQFSEVMVLQNGASSPAITHYGILNTGANVIIYTANVSGTTVNLLAQGTSGSDNLRIQKTYFNL